MLKKIRIQGAVLLFKQSRHPIKLTALIYLKEALLAERYEECADIIRTAIEFGAEQFEIQGLLENPKREP